jgi:hypothetical protein
MMSALPNYDEYWWTQIGRKRLTHTIPAERLLSEVALKQEIRNGRRHFVYVLCRPNGQPFYVGKGVGNRALHHAADARTTSWLSHKLNVIRTIHRSGNPISYFLDSFHEEEIEAHARERFLIQSIGRHDLGKGPLTNQTEGGEGASNPSEESRERRKQTLCGDQSDDPDRQAANRSFQNICDVESIPIKPIGSYKIEGLWRNRAKLSMKPRQAAALVASATANRVMLHPGALIPRRMTVHGVAMIIENGVGRDTLSSDMTTIEDGTIAAEVLRVTDAGFRFILQAIDHNLMLDAGIVEPES